ncbi:MAG TPA: LysR family transcriptional regulator [Bordetella sp.]
MDWDNARTFLALYRSGTLRAAAVALQVDQATVGRRLAALEASLEARLFLRTPRGYVPTTAGEMAYAAAERMEQAADQLARQMQGLDRRLSGVVRVATSDTIGRHFLMQAIAQVQAQHPDIQVVLATSPHVTNLTRREADLAVRVVRPDNPELIVRHLSRRTVGLYATQDYLQRYGEPRPGEAFAGHRLVAYERGLLPQRPDTFCGEPTHNAVIAVEVNSGLLMMEAVASGLGIGELPNHLTQEFAQLVRLWPRREEGYDIWLVMHSDLHRTARVRAVADAIVESFAQA